MQNNRNQLQNYPTQGYVQEDEIDLYDLVEILVKNRMIILITALVVTIGAMGAAFKVDRDYRVSEKIRIESLEAGTEKKQKDLDVAKMELESVEQQLKNIIEEETTKYENAQGISELINLKYSGLIREIKEKTEEYNRVRVAYRTIQVPAKNKAKLILAVGMVLGLFTGIFMAFVKEFIEGYKKSKEERDKK